MEYQVYILLSEKYGRYYTGMSSDVGLRLEFHNTGMNVSTRYGLPWVRVWLSEKLNRYDAVLLEKKIKKRGAGRFLQDQKNGKHSTQAKFGM